MATTVRCENKGIVTFKIRAFNGRDKNGKKITANITFKPNQSLTPKQQEKEALRFAMEFEDEFKNGKSFDGNKIAFERFAEDWLKSVKPNLAYSTYDSYVMILNNKIIPYFGHYKMSKIKLPMVEGFYSEVIKAVSYNTVKKYKNILNSMFKTAIRWQMIENNPCTNAVIPKINKRDEGIKFFTPEQSLIFLKSLDREYESMYRGHDRIDDTGKLYHVNEYVERRIVDTQYKVFYSLALFCGLRKGELLALTWNDIDFKERFLKINKSVGKSENGIAVKNPKTKTSIRRVPIPEEIMPLIRSYQREYKELKLMLGTYWKGNGNIFIREDGQLMGYSTPYQFFLRHIDRHNEWVINNEDLEEREKIKKTLPKIPLHGLRHSCATLLNYLGTDIVTIAKTLGHAQTSTTLNIYAHSFEEQSRVASDKMDEFLRANA